MAKEKMITIKGSIKNPVKPMTRAEFEKLKASGDKKKAKPKKGKK